MDIDKDSSTTPSPKSLASCLPYIWSRLLFPGDRVAGGPWKWSALLFLLILPGVLLYPCLSFYLFEPDESRYAEIPREMLIRGEWTVPYLQSEPYLDKPPLMYWLVMLSYKLCGVHDWAARLVPALAVHGTILLVYFLGRRSLGERAAFWGALTLALAPGFTCVGRLLVLDGVLAFCTTFALFALFEATRRDRLRWSWWIISAIACGLGILTKGPVAILLVVPSLLLYRWLCATSCSPRRPARNETQPGERAVARINKRAWLAYVLVLLVISLPWYVALCLHLPQFALYFLWEQNIVRFFAPFDHLQPFWFYGPVLLVGLLPATWLAIPFVRFLITSDPAVSYRRSPELGFMVLAGGWCVLFFSLSGCKLPTYILPAFPMLALAFGYFLMATRWHASRWIRPMAVSGCLLIGFAHYVAIPRYAHFRSPMRLADKVEEYCGDPNIPVLCFPRHCDSVSFYMRRDDLLNYRSKDTPAMVSFLHEQKRAVLLFTHRHSLEALREVLPKPLRLTREVALGGSWKKSLNPEYCYMAVIENGGK